MLNTDQLREVADDHDESSCSCSDQNAREMHALVAALAARHGVDLCVDEPDADESEDLQDLRLVHDLAVAQGAECDDMDDDDDDEMDDDEMDDMDEDGPEVSEFAGDDGSDDGDIDDTDDIDDDDIDDTDDDDIDDLDDDDLDDDATDDHIPIIELDIDGDDADDSDDDSGDAGDDVDNFSDAAHADGSPGSPDLVSTPPVDF